MPAEALGGAKFETVLEEFDCDFLKSEAVTNGCLGSLVRIDAEPVVCACKELSFPNKQANIKQKTKAL